MDLKMEVYSPFLELLGILELHNSVIWERKAFSAGSFSVEALAAPETLALLVPNNILWIEGDTAGIIEYVHQSFRETGPYITVKGRELTGILDWYILWGRYDLNGTVPALMRKLVDDCCIHPSAGADPELRAVPGLVLEEPAPAGGPSIRAQKTGGTLLEALEGLGEAYGVAFGIRFNPEVPRMEFWARPGVNRSVSQSENEPVFFSTELDDVLSSEYAYDSGNYRNIALVAGEGEGRDRVMVTVNADTAPAPAPPTPEAKYTITLSVDPANGGTASGGGQVSDGQSVTVTASPSSGYTFSGWRENGAIISTDISYTFTPGADRSLTAVFTPSTHNITVNVTDPALGTLLNIGELTVAGDRITQETQTVKTTQTQAEVKFVLTRSITKARAVAVNGKNIGTVKNANESVATTLPTQDNMTVDIVFTIAV